MNLTEMQTDALKEIMNIGVSKSATPVYTEDSLPQILSKMANDMAVLVVKTALCASKRDITGTLVIVITSEMVDSLISKLSRFCDFMEKDAP